MQDNSRTNNIHNGKKIKIKPGSVKFNFEDALERSKSGDVDKNSFWSLDGRSTRSEWWKVVVLLNIVSFAAIGLLVYCIQEGAYPLAIIGVIFIGVSWIFTMPVSIRRLHDKGLGGWVLFLLWIGRTMGPVGWLAYVAEIVLLGCLDGDVGENEYGPDPKNRIPVPKVVVKGASPVPTVVTAAPGVQATGGASNVTVNVGPKVNNETTNIDTLTDRLEKLAKLREKGYLSEEEFSTQKVKILAQM